MLVQKANVMLNFRDSYILDLQTKRRSSRGFQAQKELSLRIENNVIFDQMNTAQGQVNSLQSDVARLSSLAAADPGNQNVQNNLASAQAQLTRSQQNLANLQTATIISMVKDNEAANGKNSKIRAEEIAAKFFVIHQVNPNIDPVSFTADQISRAGPGNTLQKIQNATEKVATATERFRNIIEGRPNSVSSAMQAHDPYHVFDPAVCGLVALDNEGNVLADEGFNIPFQYVSDFKESKAGSYESVNPPGRFEPYQIYTGAEPFQISFTAGYHCFDTGPDFDEGFVQEVKDRLFASQYPIYQKNQRSGVRSYGAPNKYILNVFNRYVNVPVVVTHVSIDEEFALDPATWLPMGFKLSVELKTSFRMSQVVSADDIVTKGIRAYSHRQTI